MFKCIILIFSCFIYFVAGFYVVNPGPTYPPTKGEVWPRPKYESKDTKYYSLNPMHFKIRVTKEKCELLTDAINRYWAVTRSLCRVHPERKIQNYQRHVPDPDQYLGALDELQVELTAPCEEYPYLGMNESYALIISKNSTLTSESVWGIMRGLETFSQLFYLTDDRSKMLINKTLIRDEPRSQHRGLLLDTSRHYISVANILLTLDAMAINKMNVFHWHIVDDQSFPYQSEKFPEISGLGAYDPSLVYSREDIDQIVQYARVRGIRVVPEFDVPGHTRSWGNAYPHVLTECYRGGKVVGLGPMDPTKNFTYKLLRDLFQEVQSWFPDKYFHIGGDEVSLDCWSSNPQLQQYMRDHNITVTELHALFMNNAIPLLANNSGVIVWQEVFDENVPLAKDTLIQVWKNGFKNEIVTVLSSGHQVLFSAAWYLDYLHSKWQDLYTADPWQMVVDMTGNRTLAAGIVGGEACMWGEMVDDRNVLNRVWPRASAVAEVLWSPASGSSLRNIVSKTYHRLEEHTCRMIRRGIDAQPASGPGFCIA